MSSTGTVASLLLCCLALVGCCDKAAVQACQAGRLASDEKLLGRLTDVNAGSEPFAVRAGARDGVEVTAAVLGAECRGGMATNGRIKLGWTVKMPAVHAVRIFVGSGSHARKTWLESAASGAEETGPWVNDNALFRIEDIGTGQTLALIRATARPCQ